jgi:abhydrolase domain-containing protein 6
MPYRCSPVPHIVKPGHHRFRRILLQFGMHALNTLLSFSDRPDTVINHLLWINRVVVGLDCRYLKAGGMTWPYLDGGTGNPVVLLHGFGATKDHMVSLAQSLVRSYRVVIPDLPGYGDHAMDWTTSYDIESQARRLYQFVHAVGIDRCHLIGVSLGGYVAALYSARFPGRVRSLTLIDSSGFGSPTPSDAVALYRQQGHNIFLYTNTQEFIRFMTFLVYPPLKLPGRLLRYWSNMGIQRLRWRQKLFADLIAGGHERLDDLAGQITAPALVLWGKQDRICHISSVAMIMERMKDCRAYIFDPCGHLPMMEYPRICRTLVGRFRAC